MTKAGTIVPNRVAQRPTWFLLLLALAAGFAATGKAKAEPPQTFGVDRWQVYGTASALARDGAVPGGGMVAVQPRSQSGESWSSGAVMRVPGAIASGERVTAVFWARAAQPTRLTVALQGGEPDYAQFATAEVALTPAWQQVTVSGTAPVALAAESQSLTVPLGTAGAEVTLGPVAFVRGTADAAAIARAFADFRPTTIGLDVRIPSEPGVVLAGTLHLPAGHGEGPFPLAILIQGHGPNGRGGYSEVVTRLTADGIAALEYDKRGIGQSTGTYEEDLHRLTADAAAAVAAMRRRPDIADSRIALVGHSQGGVIAPAAAAADPGIAAVAMLAGSVGEGLPYLRNTIYRQRVLGGTPEALAAAAVDAAMNLLQARMDGRDAETIARLRTSVVDRFEAAGFTRPQAERALAQIDVPTAWKANKLRSASDLKALQMPVLAIFGSKDRLVIAMDEAAAARAALAGNRRARVVVLDGLSHWFQEGTVTGTADEASTLGPNLGSPRLVALLGNWLRDALAPRTGEAAASPPAAADAAPRSN